jgi:hypothetical protein
MDITVRFTTKFPPDVSSLVIARLGGAKKFSHCMLIYDDMAYEATILHGCRFVPLKVAMKGVAYYQDMLIPINDVSKMVKFGDEQMGKKYDYFGALGIPVLASEDWADWSKWWCSELVFAMIGAGGNWVLDPEVQKRVTPQDLLDLNFPKSAVINNQVNNVLCR